MNQLSVDSIRGIKCLTKNERLILIEIYLLLTRGKDGTCFATNKWFANKLILHRDTVAHVIAELAYKKKLIKNNVERKDGTKQIIKRTITINYLQLGKLLGTPVKIKKQPIPEKVPARLPIIQSYDQIDFSQDENTIFAQWSDYLIAELDRKTNIVNPTSREKKSLKGIINDSRRIINSSNNNTTNSASFSIHLMQDRRVEAAIFYTLKQMKTDTDNGFVWSEDGEGWKTINSSDLSYTFMRNMYAPFPEVLSLALTHKAEEGFHPAYNEKDDYFMIYEHEDAKKSYNTPLGNEIPY